MQPRDRLTAKEIQVATLVWQGLTNKDIAGVLLTSEQVVKKLPAHRLRQAGSMDAAGTRTLRGRPRRANWHMQLGNGLLPPGQGGA